MTLSLQSRDNYLTAVSVFEVILVDFDKFWDEQACQCLITCWAGGLTRWRTCWWRRPPASAGWLGAVAHLLKLASISVSQFTKSWIGRQQCYLAQARTVLTTNNSALVDITVPRRPKNNNKIFLYHTHICHKHLPCLKQLFALILGAPFVYQNISI